MHIGTAAKLKEWMNAAIRLRKSCNVGAAATTNNNKLKAKNVCIFHLLRRAHTSRYIVVCLSSFVCRCCRARQENRIKKKIETKSNAHKCTRRHTYEGQHTCEIRAATMCALVRYHVLRIPLARPTVQHTTYNNKAYRHRHTQQSLHPTDYSRFPIHTHREADVHTRTHIQR